MRRLPLLGILAVLLLFAGCEKTGTLDLEGLAGQARGGDAAACAELVELLATPDTALGDRVYALVIGLGEPVVPALLARQSSANDDQRERVVAALGNLKVRAAAPGLAQQLADHGRKRRYIVAWSLGEIGDPASLPALVAALDDDEELVRRYATRSLIKYNQAAVAPLLAVLPAGNDRLAAGAVRVLGDIGDRQALDGLLALVGGPIRAEVFLALGKLRDPRAESALIAGLADRDWQVRMNAAMALGPIGSNAAVAPLRKALEDDVLVVREWSARSLSTITGHTVNYRDAGGAMVAPYSVYH